MYDETKRFYNEIISVESTLYTQLTASINGDYLLFQNVHTDMINDSIPDIFTFLLTIYGKITTGQLEAKESEVDDMVYDPFTIVETVFNKVHIFKTCVLLLVKIKQIRN